VRPCEGHDQGNTIAVNEEVPFGEMKIRKCGEPYLVDPFNLGPSFEDAAGWTDDHGIIGMIGCERRSVMRVPVGFPTFEHRRDFFASHRMIVPNQAAPLYAGTIGRPRSVFNKRNPCRKYRSNGNQTGQCHIIRGQ